MPAARRGAQKGGRDERRPSGKWWGWKGAAGPAWPERESGRAGREIARSGMAARSGVAAHRLPVDVQVEVHERPGADGGQDARVGRVVRQGEPLARALGDEDPHQHAGERRGDEDAVADPAEEHEEWRRRGLLARGAHGEGGEQEGEAEVRDGDEQCPVLKVEEPLRALLLGDLLEGGGGKRLDGAGAGGMGGRVVRGSASSAREGSSLGAPSRP